MASRIFSKSLEICEKLAKRLGLDPQKTHRIEIICAADEMPHARVEMHVDDEAAEGILADLEGVDVPVKIGSLVNDMIVKDGVLLEGLRRANEKIKLSDVRRQLIEEAAKASSAIVKMEVAEGYCQSCGGESGQHRIGCKAGA